MELFNKKLDEISFDCQILGNIGISLSSDGENWDLRLFSWEEC